MIVEEMISFNTSYGKIHCNLRNVMKNRKISMYKLIKLSGLKYEVVSKYYYDNVCRYDSDVLAKFCYILKCTPNDIIKYTANIK